MFPPVLEVKGYGGVIGKSWEGALGGFENFLMFSAGSLKLLDFIGRARGGVVNDVKVRVNCGAH